MFDALLKTFIRFRHCNEGVTLVQYGVAVALAVSVGVGALTLLGTDITDAMGAAGTVMPTECTEIDIAAGSAQSVPASLGACCLLFPSASLTTPPRHRLTINGVCHGISIILVALLGIAVAGGSAYGAKMNRG